jgi:hypothetical protein
MKHVNCYWQIDTHDWSIDGEEDRFTLRAPHQDAELAIDTYDSVATDHWQAMLANAANRVAEGYQAETVVCGDYEGVTYESHHDGSPHREWILEYAGVAVFVTLFGSGGQYQRHLDTANSILASMTSHRP